MKKPFPGSFGPGKALRTQAARRPAAHRGGRRPRRLPEYRGASKPSPFRGKVS